jgi:hypothetical protein
LVSVTLRKFQSRLTTSSFLCTVFSCLPVRENILLQNGQGLNGFRLPGRNDAICSLTPFDCALVFLFPEAGIHDGSYYG